MKTTPVDIRKKGFHLAGIIPAPDSFFDFDYQWPNCLTPMADGGLSFLEYAVHKCLCMGCRTIWIGTERKGYKLIRDKVGEYAKSDIARYEPMVGGKTRLRVPIFYWHTRNPNPKKYRTASITAKLIEMTREITKYFSERVKPSRYFVSFPGCIYPLQDLRDFRKSRHKTTIPRSVLKYDNKTILDGVMRDFVCQIEDQRRFDGRLKHVNIGFVGKREARQSPQGFDEILSYFYDIEDLGLEEFETQELYAVDDWQSYRQYLGSDLEIEYNEDLVDGSYVHRRLDYERDES